MGWGKVVLVLVAFQATSTLLLQRAAAGDSLAPLLAPVMNATCNNVECGKGTCKSSLNYTFGFECECNPGWSQFHDFPFSPCVIPNCSINYSCYNNSEAPASSPAPPLTNTSIFDPCLWSYCGGGKCVKTSTFDYRCECQEGFSNLLNITGFPCYKDCALGADCANIGIPLWNTTASPASPPSLPNNGSSFAGDANCDNVECGKGTCKSSTNNTFGFVCACNPGWSQFHYYPFSPCVIPNCSINYSCYNNSEAPASSPAPSVTNTSIFDPCFWSYCGGGKCVKTSTFDHRCECEEGFSNLLNITRFPCYKDCAFGADCANLGIALSNASSPTSPSSQSDKGSSFAGDSFAPNNLLWLFVSVISLVVVRAT